MKTCSACKVEKPVEEFYRRTASKDGLTALCKPCADERTSPTYKRDRYYIKKYGITADEFDRIWHQQHGLCANCRQPADRPHLDHDHTTGAVRGILCHNCNVGLGHFMDDPELLLRAIHYLHLHGKRLPQELWPRA